MQRRSTWTRHDTFDVSLAVLLALLALSVLSGLRERGADDLAVATGLAMVHSLAVAGRRRIPRSAFVVSAVAGLVYLTAGLPMVGLGLASLVMVYSLAAEVPRLESLIGLGAVEIGMLAGHAISGTDVQLDTVAGNVLVLAVAWFIGDTVRRRREQALADRDRAARQAVADERLRIARELHDVVAHSMSAVTIQAGMARLVIDDDPQLAKGSIAAIERAGQQALEEMRRLLHVLRSDDDRPSARVPTPTLADLDELIDQARRSGTPVELAVTGDAPAVAPGVQLAAYRVVQEALTNVRKHAPGSGAHVHIAYEDNAVIVRVDSDLGPDPHPSAGGHGLAGMRERVGLYAGTLEAGPSGDSFRVNARIPYGGERP